MAIGPTVSGTSDYAFPDSIRVLKLTVDDVPWQRYNLEAVEEADAGYAWLSWPTGAGVFAPVTDVDGDEFIRLYPTPSQSGLTISAKVVANPPELVDDDDTTVFPDEQDRALIYEAGAVSYELSEDNLEQAQVFRNRFDEIALELKRLRIGRTGRGPRAIPIAGVPGSG